MFLRRDHLKNRPATSSDFVEFFDVAHDQCVGVNGWVKGVPVVPVHSTRHHAVGSDARMSSNCSWLPNIMVLPARITSFQFLSPCVGPAPVVMINTFSSCLRVCRLCLGWWRHHHLCHHDPQGFLYKCGTRIYLREVCWLGVTTSESGRMSLFIWAVYWSRLH